MNGFCGFLLDSSWLDSAVYYFKLTFWNHRILKNQFVGFFDSSGFCSLTHFIDFSIEFFNYRILQNQFVGFCDSAGICDSAGFCSLDNFIEFSIDSKYCRILQNQFAGFCDSAGFCWILQFRQFHWIFYWFKIPQNPAESIWWILRFCRILLDSAV